MRKEHLVLVYGRYEIIQEEHPDIYAFRRTSEEEEVLVLLNFSATESTIDLPDDNLADTPLINNYPELAVEGSTVRLRPYQAVVSKVR